MCAQEASERQYASANARKKGFRGDGSCTSNLTKHFGRAHPDHPIGVSSILSKAELGRVKSESSQQESQNKGLDSPSRGWSNKRKGSSSSGGGSSVKRQTTIEEVSKCMSNNVKDHVVAHYLLYSGKLPTPYCNLCFLCFIGY